MNKPEWGENQMKTTINYGEKETSEMTNFKIKKPAGITSVMELLINEKDLTIKEYFAGYRKLGLPIDLSKFKEISDLVPEKINLANREGQRGIESSILFEFKNDKILEIPTIANTFGIKFQDEMIGYLKNNQFDEYKELLKVADRSLSESIRSVADVIKYATDSVPATRSGYLLLNKQVSGFSIYSRPNDGEVLGFTSGNSQRETMIPLEKTNMQSDQRREFIETKSKENLLKREMTKN